MRAQVQLEPAYLLAQRPYRESSALLEVFTPAQGRVGLVARGARGPKSRLRGVLQPFAPLMLSWYSGGELGTLRAAEARSAPVVLTGERVFFGWYLNELLMRLVPRQDPHPALFALYEAVLACLTGSAGEAEGGLRLFEKRLLAEIGYGLRFPRHLDAAAHYRLDADGGFVIASEGYSGSCLSALRDERFDDPALRGELRRVLRESIRRQLGGRELESAALLRRMRRDGA
ncbi:DNA repair protein RecO [Fontimonas sp. SYSU GA230001]|uniref:DNA repair protein RecO n=1 Tax=Fontimonas sp. SYSU GA230001 TaxID=3142450 RepID=UPI0032B31042